MITLRVSGPFKHKDPTGGTIVCPECLEDAYIFYAACPECGADTFEARNMAADGLEGRLTYYRAGWPEMDKLAHQRLKELHSLDDIKKDKKK